MDTLPDLGQAFQKRRLSMKNIYVGNLDFKGLYHELFTPEQLAQKIADGKIQKPITLEAIQKAGLPVFAYGSFPTGLGVFSTETMSRRLGLSPLT